MQTNALRLAVQGEADGDDLLSLRLDAAGYRTNYRPREWATVDERPKLTLTYYY